MSFGRQTLIYSGHGQTPAFAGFCQTTSTALLFLRPVTIGIQCTQSELRIWLMGNCGSNSFFFFFCCYCFFISATDAVDLHASWLQSQISSAAFINEPGVCQRFLAGYFFVCSVAAVVVAVGIVVDAMSEWTTFRWPWRQIDAAAVTCWRARLRPQDALGRLHAGCRLLAFRRQHATPNADNNDLVITQNETMARELNCRLLLYTGILCLFCCRQISANRWVVMAALLSLSYRATRKKRGKLRMKGEKRCKSEGGSWKKNGKKMTLNKRGEEESRDM